MQQGDTERRIMTVVGIIIVVLLVIVATAAVLFFLQWVKPDLEQQERELRQRYQNREEG